ncbi:7179_t:CDS:2 [Diversispora eburnea]|uniref:7179_t:CDS:1 n=1 Tax=Diversispora eburnea TaxID=1213867 RepID=A0A9N9CVK7_9GLOM|nr:7179_t:CDS:2 [Diversispora eburnea]
MPYNLLENYVQCTYCKSVLKHNNTTETSTLICHMKNTKYKKYMKVNESQQTLQLSALSLVTYKFSQERSHQDLSKILIMCAYPFHMIKASIMIQEAPGHLSYTTDLWTSNQNLEYMVVICHFVDKNWKLQKLVLAFKIIPAPYTKITISKMLFNIFEYLALRDINFEQIMSSDED